MMDVLNALEKQAKQLEESIAACEIGGSFTDVAILHDRLTRCIELYADLIDSDYPVRHGLETAAATAAPFAHYGDSDHGAQSGEEPMTKNPKLSD